MEFYYARHKDLNFLNPESHKIFRKLVEDIKVGIFMVDTLGKLFYVNKAFADTLELHSCSEVMGQGWTEVCFYDHDRRDQFIEELDSVGVVRDFEIAHISSRGHKSQLLITANYIYSDQGEKIGVYGSLVNISLLRQLEEDLLVKNKKLEQILSFCNTLGDIFQLEELTKYIVSETAEILDVKRCSIMFADDSSNELYVHASCGLSEEMIEKTKVRIGEPVAGIVALQSKAVLVEDIEEGDIFKQQNKQAYTQRSFMSAPLFYNQKLLGILNVSEKQGQFTKMDLKVLETIAQQAAVSINKTQTLSALHQLSHTDPMTGLLNYRSFIQKIDEEVQRVKRYGTTLSLMMVDIDNFKTYNDTFGHPEGDKLLRRIGEIFKVNLRTTEFICRYAGDEFCIIFPQTDGMRASVAAEKIRQLVAKEFSKEKISISIGIAQFQADSNKETLIKQADESLYHSKKAGRNKVSFYQSAETSLNPP
ncbi:MAG: diguanylate cyclase [Candidatus Omnitrophota bacterium]